MRNRYSIHESIQALEKSEAIKISDRKIGAEKMDLKNPIMKN
jgi:hypothetical protein